MAVVSREASLYAVLQLEQIMHVCHLHMGFVCVCVI